MRIAWNTSRTLVHTDSLKSGRGFGGLLGGQLLPRMAFVAACALCLSPWAMPAVAFGLGVALALLIGNPFQKAGHRASKWLLQVCVVMLGFGMDLPTVLRAGAGGSLFAAGSIAATMLLGYFVGRRLKVHPKASALISAGTAICGGSAIAAVGSVISAAEGEIAVAMGTVFLLNAAALYLFPPLGHALHLSQSQFGTWAGVAIHDISSVVGASARYGLTALQTATAVKLSRTLWIVPVALAMAYAAGARRRPAVANSTFGFRPERASTPERQKVQVPWFVGLFLLASVARSYVPGVAAVAPMTAHVAIAGLTLALFLIGAGLSASTLKAVGWKAMVQGLLLWAFISGASLLVVMRWM
ncbi:MAG TPA: putative sulfate exporter family transporter [Tepidisphaeraceae bacterium]